MAMVTTCSFPRSWCRPAAAIPSLFATRAASQGSYTEVISQAYSGAGFYIGTDPGGNMRASDAWGSTGVASPRLA
jgi:hypothetical protein